MTKFALLLAVLVLLMPAGWVEAQTNRTERVSFAPGTSGTTLQGQIRGYDSVDYVLNARGGQRMVVEMTTSNPSAYFNLMPSGDPQAIFVGSTSGLRYDGVLPSGGDWVVRVYLMRNAARRGEAADYRLSIRIGGAGAALTPDYADGNAGGPDWWRINVATLNIRSGPSTAYGVVAKANAGAIMRNLGCQGLGTARWCRLQTADGGVTGWAAGRYLVESGAPSASAPPPISQPPAPGGDFADRNAGGPDWWEVTGVASNDTLKIRSGPSASAQIVATVQNGARLRNLGCQMNGATRWCQVERPNGTKRGWAAG